MGFITLQDEFHALDDRHAAHLIGKRAQSLSNVNLDAGSIKPLLGLGSTATTGSGTLRSIWKFGALGWDAAMLTTIAWQYVEFNSQIMRAAAGSTPQRSADGITWRDLGIAAPAQLAGLTLAAGALTGTYTYYATYTSSLGGESAPSVVSAGISPAGQSVDVPLVASADAQVNGIKLYRAGGAATGILLVGSYANTTATRNDNVADGSLGAAITTTTYGVPGNLEGIVVTPYGVLMGWIGDKLYFSETALPSAWPATNFVQTTEAIKAVVPYAGGVLIITGAAPYLLLGTGSATFQLVRTLSQQGCKDRDTAVDMGDSVWYLSNDGICRFAGNNTIVVSKESLADSTVSAISATNAKAVRYNESYFLFHSAGWIQWDPRTQGNWKKGDTVVNAVHYNKSADILYVAQTATVKGWEQGTALTFSYRTPDWEGETPQNKKHLKMIGILHDGEITAQPYMDGVAAGSLKTLTRSTLGLSEFRLPAGIKGHRVSVELASTADVSPNANVTAILAKFGAEWKMR